MKLQWWKESVVYQMYPRSFADGNGDGIGDFIGMTSKLDYLRDLGIDAVWLSPHYPSPLLDCGYDISDYTAVDPAYGSLQDFTTFLHEAHARSIRVILDLVLNHTSDQHPWFSESRSSRAHLKRDWYIWRDGLNDGPPNNWASIFGRSAWTLDPTSGQYYYHAFLKEQPDLNWRNPQVKQAMWDVVRFWLDLGVDGFRLDAIATIFEHPNLPNHTLPLTPDQVLDANALDRQSYEELLRFQIRQPGMHELMQELRALVDEYPGDRVLVGEDEDVAFHGSGDDELHLVFNFPLMRCERLTAEHIRANQALRLAELPPSAWPCNTLGNHDSPRLWSRYGDGRHDAALARLHAALMLTLKGTPFLYNGEEIGMTNLELTSITQFQDTVALRQYRVLTEYGETPEAALRIVAAFSRDRCRSPMQWNDLPNAGFSPAAVATWLPVNPNFAGGVNVAAQEHDPASLLSFYRHLLMLRRATPALVAGDYAVMQPTSVDYLAFLRHDQTSGQTCLVALNLTNAEQTVSIALGGKQLQVLFSSAKRDEQRVGGNTLQLAAFEVLIAELV